MADKITETGDKARQIESLQRQLEAALKLAESEKRKRKEQFSEASAKIAKAEKQLAESKAQTAELTELVSSPVSPRKFFQESGDSDSIGDATTFLGCPMFRRTGKLILDDGNEFVGFSFGAPR